LAIERIPLHLVDDNPFNPRKTFPAGDVKELAYSIRQIGLRQIPEARKVDGDRYQLVYGSMRKRAFLSLVKEFPGETQWAEMPIDVKEFDDKQMFNIAWHENLHRSGVSALDLARSVDSFIKEHGGTETEVAESLHLTQGAVANLRRVLALPEDILKKINDGRINFTMARSLLVLTGLSATLEEKAKGKDVSKYLSDIDLMKEAIDQTAVPGQTARMFDTQTNTVKGMERAIHTVASRYFKPLEKSQEDPRLGFDAIGAGCITKCKKCLTTHPKTEEAKHWCTDSACWTTKQQEHVEKVAAEAKANMEKDIGDKAAAVAADEISPDSTPPRISQEIVVTDQKLVLKIQKSLLAFKGDLTETAALVKNTFLYDTDTYVMVATEFNGAENLFECYKIISPKDYTGVPYYYNSVTVECKRDNPKGFFDGTLALWDKEQVVLAGPPVIFVYTPQVEGKAPTAEVQPVTAKPAETPKFPKKLFDKTQKESGTRAELIDIATAGTGTYEIIGQAIPWIMIDNATECQKECIKGFHHAYSSMDSSGKGLTICTNLDCLKNKMADAEKKFTDAGTANKKAEVIAVKEALGKTKGLGKPQIKVILLAFLQGCYVNPAGYGEGIRSPADLIWGEVSPETMETERTVKTLMGAVDDLAEDQLAKLVTELCLYSLAWHGDVKGYKIQLTEAMKYLGVKLTKPEGAK
jgi:ParB/RepB/Spo0J family partition protein